MKFLKLFLLVIATTIVSCSAVRVTTDYDTKVDFNQYKTFAFYKKGIDKARISDLDKRRIMRAIETQLLAKGLKKSNNPDILVSLFTKSRKRVNINSYGDFYYPYGGYYYPYYYGYNPVNISKYTEGTLFIDLIDKNKKQLVWQGIGTGYLSTKDIVKKEKRINEFVAKIIEKYPIGKQKK